MVMTRLRGAELRGIWTGPPDAERVRLVCDIGRAVAALHQIPANRDLQFTTINWLDFALTRSAAAVEQQRAMGLEPSWLKQIDRVETNLDVVPSDVPPVLLHCELSDAVWLVEERSGMWQLCGLFDFADAMVGHAHYDLGGVPLSLARGEPAMHRAFLDGYGMPLEAADKTYGRRLLFYLFCHPYASLPFFLKTTPPPDEVRTLDQLADFWFAV